MEARDIGLGEGHREFAPIELYWRVRGRLILRVLLRDYGRKLSEMDPCILKSNEPETASQLTISIIEPSPLARRVGRPHQSL